MTIDSWQKRMETDVFASYRRISCKTFVLPNGAEAQFEIKQEPRCVCVLALTTCQTVLLVQQFRPGPEAILLELLGGGVSPDEDPASAATRELLEETGYRGGLELAGSSWHCRYSTRRTYHFVARSCVKVQEPTPDDLEFLEVVEMSLADLKQHMQLSEHSIPLQRSNKGKRCSWSMSPKLSRNLLRHCEQRTMEKQR